MNFAETLDGKWSALPRLVLGDALGGRDALAHGLVRTGSCVAGEHRLSDHATPRVATSPRSRVVPGSETGRGGLWAAPHRPPTAFSRGLSPSGRPTEWSFDIWTVTASRVAARAPCREIRRGEHEISSRRIGVAVFGARDCPGVRGEDFAASRILFGKPRPMRLVERSRREPLLAAASQLVSHRQSRL